MLLGQVGVVGELDRLAGLLPHLQFRLHSCFNLVRLFRLLLGQRPWLLAELAGEGTNWVALHGS